MKRYFLFAILSLSAAFASAQIKEGDREWLNHIRTDHPRMFITAEDIPQIAKAANSYENYCFRTMQKQVDKLLTKDIVFNNIISI